MLITGGKRGGQAEGNLGKNDGENFEVAVMMLRWEENDFDREGTERRFKRNT